jgi:uncharacterized membrane protein
MNILISAAQLTVGFVFAAAALGKLRQPRALERTLRGLGMRRLVRTGALAALAVEGTLSLLILTSIGRLVAEIAATSVLAAMAGISLFALSSGRTVPCNCFGPSDRTLGIESLITAVALLGAQAVVLIYDVMTGDAPSVSFSSVALAVVILSAALWFRAVPALAELRRQRVAILAASN